MDGGDYAVQEIMGRLQGVSKETEVVLFLWANRGGLYRVFDKSRIF